MPGSPQPPAKDWLALGPASRLLGVDPDTLRRWADEGRVEAYLTPGGHRRFERGALERIVSSKRSRPPASLSNLGATPERLSRAYRRSYASARSASGHTTVGMPDREAYRGDGRRLVEALVAHLDAQEPAARRRAERRAVACTDDVARRLAVAGIDLPEAIGQFVTARRPLLTEIGALAARPSMDPTTLSNLYQQATDLLDRLLLRLIATYRAARDERIVGRPGEPSS